ncbi:unnamed protein product [Linum trigynum]|uniref:Uncharacterized protein n=1 Tax=Linum trigynum TaxID=586398 RepID=A0AAV2ECD0_9ROSI
MSLNARPREETSISKEKARRPSCQLKMEGRVDRGSSSDRLSRQGRPSSRRERLSDGGRGRWRPSSEGQREKTLSGNLERAANEGRTPWPSDGDRAAAERETELREMEG